MSEQREPEKGNREGGRIAAGDAVAISAELATHGEMLRRILTLLQVEEDSDRAQLGDLLQALISEIGQNSRVQQTLTTAITKLGRDLPGELVAAIDENLDIGRRTDAEHSTNGGGSLPS